MLSGLGYAPADVPSHLSTQAAQALNVLFNDVFYTLLVGGCVFGIASAVAILRGAALPNWLGWAAIVIGITMATPAFWIAAIALFVSVLIVAALIYARTGAVGDPGQPVIIVEENPYRSRTIRLTKTRVGSGPLRTRPGQTAATPRPQLHEEKRGVLRLGHTVESGFVFVSARAQVKNPRTRKTEEGAMTIVDPIPDPVPEPTPDPVPDPVPDPIRRPQPAQPDTTAAPRVYDVTR